MDENEEDFIITHNLDPVQDGELVNASHMPDPEGSEGQEHDKSMINIDGEYMPIIEIS